MSHRGFLDLITKDFFVAETKTAIAALVVLASAVTVFSTKPEKGIVGGINVRGEALAEAPVQEILPTPVVPEPEDTGELLAPDLNARAVLVKDLLSGKTLFEKNPRKRLPIASLTKLMTALVVINSAPLDQPVEVELEDLKVPPEKAGLVVGEQITVQDLLKAMLISSANDAAMTLGRFVGPGIENFAEKMNEKATELGMVNTQFANPVGFDDASQYSTADDLALLVQEFVSHPELLAMTKEKSAVVKSTDGKIRHYLKTTNKLLATHKEVLGLKTGYTEEALGNLIVLVKAKDTADGELIPEYYSILLGSQDRETESESIINWVKENFAWN